MLSGESPDAGTQAGTGGGAVPAVRRQRPPGVLGDDDVSLRLSLPLRGGRPDALASSHPGDRGDKGALRLQAHPRRAAPRGLARHGDAFLG